MLSRDKNSKKSFGLAALTFAALIKGADADPAKEVKPGYKPSSEVPYQHPTESAVTAESGAVDKATQSRELPHSSQDKLERRNRL